MFKIREFAEIAQIPASTLRYYDEIGLFKPVQVDPETGYRFYAIEQLLQLNRILALKDLGLELTQIVQLLDEEISAEALQGMLRLRQAKLQQQIQTEQEQLARIEARLKYLQQDGHSLVNEVVLKETKAWLVAVSPTRATGFLPNARAACAFVTLLRQHNLTPVGPVHFLYPESTSSEADFAIEVAVPIEYSNLAITYQGQQVSIRELPAIPRMASTVYHGSPHAIVSAYQALGTWIQANGYIITGPCRKLCLRWKGDLSDYLTEIQFPVEREG